VRAVERRDAAQTRLHRRQPKAGRARPAAEIRTPPLAGDEAACKLEPPTDGFPFDPNGPPVATFFEAGGNIEGGLPYTDWSREIRKQRFEVDKAKDNPDANCMPMGFLQFHQQPQPRKIIQTKQMILIEYEANYGIRHIYLDGRKLPPQGEPQPWWYGYSVGTWDGDTLVVETNNLRARKTALGRMAGRQRQPLQPRSEVHRAHSTTEVRPVADRHDTRRFEGLHKTVDGAHRSAIPARPGTDRVRL
jgi:hypothetical protein